MGVILDTAVAGLLDLDAASQSFAGKAFTFFLDGDLVPVARVSMAWKNVFTFVAPSSDFCPPIGKGSRVGISVELLTGHVEGITLLVEYVLGWGVVPHDVPPPEGQKYFAITFVASEIAPC